VRGAPLSLAVVVDEAPESPLRARVIRGLEERGHHVVLADYRSIRQEELEPAGAVHEVGSRLWHADAAVIVPGEGSRVQAWAAIVICRMWGIPLYVLLTDARRKQLDPVDLQWVEGLEPPGPQWSWVSTPEDLYARLGAYRQALARAPGEEVVS
jgi:hypothetical protein